VVARLSTAQEVP